MDNNNNSANMKLEPGMMCLVIGFKKQPVNVGKVVVLERLMFEGDRTPSGATFKPSTSGNAWLVTGECLFKYVVDAASGGSYEASSYAIQLESHLMPIRPEKDPLEMSIQSIEDYLDSKQKEKV